MTGNNGCVNYLRRLGVRALWLLIVPISIAVADNEELPELGDSAARVLSPAQEKKIGQQFLRKIIRSNDYISDPELNAYLNQLAMKVAKNASLRGTPITVHLLKQSDLNAFAVPGGHITFHTGLILITENESELASVMAHETAHISQRHLPRLLAKAEASKFPAAAAILGSILVGGQAGLAGISLANAALLSRQLAYTRDFEREADSIGIKLLSQAGFDPSAMGRFFNKLDRHSGLNETPEFLRTHPLSYTRIAEAENRSALYPPTDYPPSRTFQFAKAKIYAKYAPRNLDVINYFTEQVKNSSDDQKHVAQYGLALAYLTQRKTALARATLKPLLKIYPDEVAIQIAQAEIEQAAGNAEAVAIYAQLSKTHPQLRYVTYYHAEALLANADAQGAKRLIRHQLRRHTDMYKLYLLLSRSNAKLGLLVEAHQATAEFHVALGENHAAVNSLKLALRENDSEGYLQQSIAARLKELEEMLGKPTSQ